MSWYHALIEAFQDPETIIGKRHQKALYVARCLNIICKYKVQLFLEQTYGENDVPADLKHFSPCFYAIETTSNTCDLHDYFAIVAHIASPAQSDLLVNIIQELELHAFSVRLDQHITTFSLRGKMFDLEAGKIMRHYNTNRSLLGPDTDAPQEMQLEGTHYIAMRNRMPDIMRHFKVVAGDMIYQLPNALEANKIADAFCNIHSMFRRYINDPNRKWLEEEQEAVYEVRILHPGPLALFTLLSEDPVAAYKALENVEYAIKNKAYYRDNTLISTPFSRIGESFAMAEEDLFEQELRRAATQNQ